MRHGSAWLAVPWPLNARSDACPQCASVTGRRLDIKEEMVRLAQQTGCHVEVVEHSDALIQLGGVGCLLRYAAPENYAEKAA